MDRRSFAKFSAAFAGASLFPHLSAASGKLPKIVKIVVPFSAGGSNDVFARALAEQLGQELKTTFIVENKPGAGGAMGSAQVAKGPADGANLLLTSNSIVTSFAVTAKPSYDPRSSFQHIAILNRGPSMLVTHNNTSYKDLPGFIEAVKSQKVTTYGSAGIGSSAHLAGEMLNDGLKSDLLHVPYKGISNVAIDIAGNNLDMVITTPASVSGQIKMGLLKPLGVTTANTSEFFPKLKPVAEYIPQYEVEAWWGVFAAADTPRWMVEMLNAKINEVAARPTLKNLFEKESTVPTSFNLEEAKDFVVKDQERWKTIAKNRKIKLI